MPSSNHLIKELSALETAHELLLEKMPCPFAIHEIILNNEGKACDYRFLKINKAFEKIMNMTADQLIGKTARQVLPSLDPSVLEIYEQVALSQKEVCFETYTAESKRFYNICCYGLQAYQFATILEDITEKKQSHEAREDFMQKLTAARLSADAAHRAKNLFLANISHEIRTPMTAIMGMAELLLETPIGPDQKHYISIIQDSGQSLLELINSTLELSKIESGSLELENIEFNLHELVESSIKIMQKKANEKQLSLRMEIDKTVPGKVIGDATRLKQMLINLLSNAIKFTERGDVTLRVEPKHKFQQDYILSFIVKDTGVGIPIEKQKNIFERFYHLDQENADDHQHIGSGLGLSIIKQLVDLMRGAIHLSSEVGVGSSFQIDIPFQECPKEEAKEPKQQAQEEIKEEHFRLKILLVDDLEDNRLLIRKYLQTYPYDIDQAGDGNEAIEKFMIHDYNLVLMDINMPHMDGHTATRLIRKLEQEQHRRKTPIVALSAYALKEEEKRSIDAGCDRHVTRPIRKNDLLNLISEQTRSAPFYSTGTDFFH